MKKFPRPEKVAAIRQRLGDYFPFSPFPSTATFSASQEAVTDLFSRSCSLPPSCPPNAKSGFFGFFFVFPATLFVLEQASKKSFFSAARRYKTDLNSSLLPVRGSQSRRLILAKPLLAKESRQKDRKLLVKTSVPTNHSASQISPGTKLLTVGIIIAQIRLHVERKLQKQIPGIL
jgi:hypothetical protein